jgi:hypothetical protein
MIRIGKPEPFTLDPRLVARLRARSRLRTAGFWA